MLPFTREQFLSVFANYNQGVWPAQVAAYLLGLAAVVAVVLHARPAGRVVGAVLAAMWVWTGVAYHGLYFSAINKPALLFGALFALQGGLFAYAAVARNRLAFHGTAGPRAWVGWGLVFYAGVLYPLIGRWAGEAYPAMPMFGITPCPVTLFSFGLLLLASGPLPRWLLVVPLLWSAIGGSAAYLLGVPQDWLLLLSGVVIAPWLLLRGRSSAGQPAHA